MLHQTFSGSGNGSSIGNSLGSQGTTSCQHAAFWDLFFEVTRTRRFDVDLECVSVFCTNTDFIGECLCRVVGQAWNAELWYSSKSPGMGCSIEGESPVRRVNHGSLRLFTARVAQFGSAEQIGRCPSAKAKYCPETDSEQVQ